MKEIRLHGRGGMGTAKGAEMLTSSFICDNKFAASFPMYGAERRGAPLTAFCRFDETPIMEKTQIYSPDCLILFDPRMITMAEVYNGLKLGSTLLLNYPQPILTSPYPNIKILGVVDATKIAIEVIGIPATNTCLLGAFAAITGWVSLDAIFLALEDYFEGTALAKNITCAQRGFQEAKVTRF